MNAKLLTKFVIDGQKKNKKTVVPFLIAGALTVMMFYILISMAYCPYIYKDGVEAFYGAQTISILLEMGAQITGIFAIIFLLYANQFMMKNRKKEMALYGVLGMSKGNITLIMFAESVFQAFFCMIVGILTGTFLNKLMLLVLYKIIKQTPVEGILFSVKGLQMTVVLFLIIFATCLIYNIASIRVGNPIELLHSDKMGEKEPKVKVIPFLIGVIALALGYYLALSAKSSSDAINVLFISVVFVMIATYCLFISGSIFILKLLKKNKKFYFQTKNFVSVSNLMFRMKHNAAGLASICILSTGVILLLTCGSSLMMLGEKSINTLYPKDIKVEMTEDYPMQETEYLSKVEDAADQAQITIYDGIFRRYYQMITKKTADSYGYLDENSMLSTTDGIDTYFVTLKDYNNYTGQNIQLGDHEVLIYQSNSEKVDEQTLRLFGTDFKIAGKVDYDAVKDIIDPTMTLFEKLIVVTDDEEMLRDFLKQDAYSEGETSPNVYIGYNTKKDLTKKDMESFTDKVTNQGLNCEVKFKIENRSFFYNVYGGVFFVGVFLSVLFLMATVMIIYYKQMAEGYEDRLRFEILSNVGLTQKEAKTVIKRQVMIMFFLPVLTAVIHVIVASKVIRLFLSMILFVDISTFIISIGIVCVIFFLVYALVYKITSIQYYKIVYAKNNI